MTEKARLGPYFDELPSVIPIFPLAGVLLLPRGQLPLNIFEDRYLAMVNDALKSDRIIGMIQPRSADNTNDLFHIGCAGRITQFEETDDGRYHITLSGLCRFRVLKEQQTGRPYRSISASWLGFEKDMESMSCLDIDRSRLTTLLKSYFTQEGLSANWETVQSVADERLMTALAMVCPLEANEKQALLEAPCCKTRAQLFFTLVEMALCSVNKSDKPN